MKNDFLHTRLPIQSGLPGLLVEKISNSFLQQNQPYLAMLYKELIITSYHGLLRVGEIIQSPHTIKAKDVHKAENKRKILIQLKTSKTHSESDKPQIIILMPIQKYDLRNKERAFCPYATLMVYMNMRGDFETDDEPLFSL